MSSTPDTQKATGTRQSPELGDFTTATFAQEIGDLHNRVLRSMLPTLKNRPSLRYVYRCLTTEAIRRGWIKRENAKDFVRWLQTVARESRAPHSLDDLEVSEPTRSYLAELSQVAKNTSLTQPDAVSVSIAQARAILRPSVSIDRELVLTETALAVFEHSAALWNETLEGVTAEALVGGELVDADVAGAITGAAGAALATWWTGGTLTGPAAGAAAAIGAVLGSAIEYLEQDAADDATRNNGDNDGRGENAVPTEGSEGSAPGQF